MKVRRRANPTPLSLNWLQAKPPPSVRPCKRRKRLPVRPWPYAAWPEPRFEFDPEYEEWLLDQYDPDAEEYAGERGLDAYYEDLDYDFDDLYLWWGDAYQESEDDRWSEVYDIRDYHEESVPMDDPRYPLWADEASWLRVYGVQSWDELEPDQ